jgi:hypothetical protein
MTACSNQFWGITVEENISQLYLTNTEDVKPAIRDYLMEFSPV